MAASLPAAPQDLVRPEVTLGRTAVPIRLDGILDEPGWQAAGLIPDLTQQSPVPGGPTPYHTEVRLLTDGATIYIGVRCADPEPGRIATHTMLRDADLSSDDAVGIVLDTFGDHRTGYIFQVNAAGARFDGLIATAEDVSADWDGIWDAKVGRDASGWTLEMAIPVATLRLTPGLGAWGFNVDRTVARDRTEMRWSGTTLDARFADMRRAGELRGVDGLDAGLGLTVTPYGLVRHGRDFVAGTSEMDGDAGLDVGWAMTRQLSGVLTVNTDFAETEVDTRQINLTRFPLFYPEKRYFFVEGANQFAFGPNLGSDFVPFFSRRVGLVGGETVPMDVGAKVIGRQGPWGIGALTVRTGASPRAPASSLSAARVTRDIGEHLRLGAIGTRGDPSGLVQNWLGGVDAVWQSSTFRGDRNLTTGGWWSRTGESASRRTRSRRYSNGSSEPSRCASTVASGSGCTSRGSWLKRTAGGSRWRASPARDPLSSCSFRAGVRIPPRSDQRRSVTPSMARTISSKVTGLRSEHATSTSLPPAEREITGMPAVRGSAFCSARKSHPSRPGMKRSRRITSIRAPPRR